MHPVYNELKLSLENSNVKTFITRDIAAKWTILATK